MIRGLYTAATGMLAEMNKHDVIANNLANVDTAGYKKDTLTLESFPLALIKAVEGGRVRNASSIGYLGTGVGISETVFDNSQGAMKETGNKLDFALMGEGFFVLDTPNGEMYTRNGSFALDAQGRLVDAHGYYVRGQNGVIQIDGDDVSVDKNGNIIVDGTRLDSFRIVEFGEPENVLRKVGENLFQISDGSATAPQLAGNVVVSQGFIETSNVDVAKETVGLIVTLRAYEANQKVIQSHNEILGKAVNDVGRLR
ncbi:MAG TPA: flagellar basal-body rod protein FlgF [Actinobacteria bacterium]|nr:flagellar basal-body rod protein FlgF [Actinomycetota bacterium]